MSSSPVTIICYENVGAPIYTASIFGMNLGKQSVVLQLIVHNNLQHTLAF